MEFAILNIFSTEDILSLVLQFLNDTIEKRETMWGILLSKYMYVPLLCRWTSSSAVSSTLYHKILDVVLDSVRHKVVCRRAPWSVAPVHVTETLGAGTYHPLVFLLDVLHTSRPNSSENIVTIFEKIATSRY